MKLFWKIVFISRDITIILFLISVVYIVKLNEIRVDALWDRDRIYKEVEEDEFLDMLNQKFVDAHEYELNYYDCKNYSRDYVFILQHLGYDAWVSAGKESKNVTSGHAWVTVVLDYDPIRNEFIDASREYPVPYSQEIEDDLNRR